MKTFNIKLTEDQLVMLEELVWNAVDSDYFPEKADQTVFSELRNYFTLDNIRNIVNGGHD